MIYNINREIEELLEVEAGGVELIDLNTGEILDAVAIQEKLANLRSQVDEKITSIIEALKHEEARIDCIEKEEERLALIKRRAENRITRAKAFLTMLVGAGKKWESEYYGIGWRRSKSVKIEDQEKLPAEFIVRKITLSPDKLKIKAHLEANMEIPGCSLSENLNIQIK